MVPRRRGGEGLNRSVGFLNISTARIAGSFLLAVTTYSSTRVTPLIPSTALGALLLIFASILAYTGYRKSLHNTPLVVSFSLSVSALWWGVGMVQVLVGQGVLKGADDLRNAMVPGFAAFTMGFFVIGVVGVLHDGVPIALMAFAISYASMHGIAMYCDSTFSSSAVACNYLIVTIVSLYLVGARSLHFFSRKRIALPGAELPNAKAKMASLLINSSRNDVVVIGLIVNCASASVFGCKILGLTTGFCVGQVPWLWMAGFFQVGVCILSYRSFDSLTATLFGFTSILKFAEGYSLLYQVWKPTEPLFPVPLFAVFALLFLVLAVFMAARSLVEGLYILLFVAYCISVACHPSGFFHGGYQGVNVALYVASGLMALAKLYNMKANIKIPMEKWTIKNLFIHTRFFKLQQEKEVHIPFHGFSKYTSGEVLGHACSVLTSFAITPVVDPTDSYVPMILPCILVTGGFLKLVCGSVAFSRGKTLESIAFILYGVMWIIWGTTRYGGLYGSTRGFHLAVGIICFILLNGIIVIGSLFLSKAWFVYCLTFELILISFLLDALGVLPAGYDVAVTIIFGLVSFYCFLSGLVNSMFEEPQLPMGHPIVKLQGYHGGSSKCTHLPARRATSVKQVSEMLKTGGVCGIPSDAGYVLAASCCRPDAVQRLYRSKSQPQTSQMALWISSMRQLEPAKPLIDPQLWDIMQTTCPSSASIIILSGEWLNCLGLKESAQYLGTDKRVTIRVPDCAITTYLIDLRSPLEKCLPSRPGLDMPADPLGMCHGPLGVQGPKVGPIVAMEARQRQMDTTHRSPLCTQLEDQADAILCDGPSLDGVSATIVDYTEIQTGNIWISERGTVQSSQVQQVLGEIQRRKTTFSVTTTSTRDLTGQRVCQQHSSSATCRTFPSNLLVEYSNEGFTSSED